jgi:hypothetical protein
MNVEELCILVSSVDAGWTNQTQEDITPTPEFIINR